MVPSTALQNRNTALKYMAEKSSYSKVSAEVLSYSYYDSFEMLAATREHELFTTGLGTGKNLSQTNMPTSGQLPQGQTFRVDEIQFLYTTGATSDEAGLQLFYEMIRDTTLEFKVTGKDSLLVITLQELVGLRLAYMSTPSVPGDNISQPQPFFVCKYKLGKKPIQIGATQSFRVLITHQVAANAALDTDIGKIVLKGCLERLS